ncbi:NlpC/P60 family protein, partial [Klebsiella quasipneumoniae]
ENLYVRHYAEAGFYSHASELQAGDVILMQYRADEINHAGIYLGNGKMLHHMYGQLSGEVPYGGIWRERTMLTLRHKNDD